MTMLAERDNMGGAAVMPPDDLDAIVDLINMHLLPGNALELTSTTNGGRPVAVSEGAVISARDVMLLYQERTDKGDTFRWNEYWARQYGSYIASAHTPHFDIRDLLPGMWYAKERLTEIIGSVFGGNVNGRSIVELGMGCGIASIMLAQQGVESIGVDNAVVANAYADLLYNHLQVKFGPQFLGQAEFRHLDFYNTGFTSGSFDLVHNSGVIEHTEVNSHRVIMEMKRVAKPGGYLLVSVPNTRSPFHQNYARMEAEVSAVDRSLVIPWADSRYAVNLKEIMEDHGLTVIKQGYYHVAPSQRVNRANIEIASDMFKIHLDREVKAEFIDLRRMWKDFEELASNRPGMLPLYGQREYIIAKKPNPH